MLKFILSMLDRRYDRAPLGQDISTNHTKAIKVGDEVEYAVLFSQHIRYRVEELFPETGEARIRLLKSGGSAADVTYRAPLQMLRHPHKRGSM